MGAWHTYCRSCSRSLTSTLDWAVICPNCFEAVWKPLLKNIRAAIHDQCSGRLSICPPNDSGALSLDTPTRKSQN